MPNPELEGKIAIITGAGAGIGRALAEAFVAEGIKVGALDIDEASASQLEDKHGRGKVLALRTDITDPASCRSGVAGVFEHFGGIDVLINNAALGMNAVHPEYTVRDLQIEDVSEELWRRFMLVNACGFFNMSKQVVPLLRPRKWGRIVNISTSYFTMMRPGYSPYGVTKAALEAHSMMLSRELAGTGITVNVVIPGGPADTAMVPDEDRSVLIPPSLMAPPILGLLTQAGNEITGGRFIAVEWDPAIADPRKQKQRAAAWPELAVPLAQMAKKG